MSDSGGVVKATGEVAGKLVDGFKSQPALLFLVVLNVFIIGLLGWLASQNAERRWAREKMILEHCLPKDRTGAIDAVQP